MDCDATGDAIIDTTDIIKNHPGKATGMIMC